MLIEIINAFFFYAVAANAHELRDPSLLQAQMVYS